MSQSEKNAQSKAHAKMHATLHSSDGTPLEIKEGVVLDSEGHVLSDPGVRRTHRAHESHHAYRDPFNANGRPAFVWKSNNPMALFILAPLLVVFLAVGLTLFAGIGAAAFIAWIVFVFFKTLRRL